MTVGRRSRRDTGMTIRVSCSIRWIAPTEHVQLWTRHDTECKMCYWFQVRSRCTVWSWRLARDLIISVIVSLSMSMCSSWYVGSSEALSSLLALTSSRSETPKAFEYNCAVSSFFEYLEWGLFMFSMLCLYSFDYLRVLCTFSNSASLQAWLILKLEELRQSLIPISSHECLVGRLGHEQSTVLYDDSKCSIVLVWRRRREIFWWMHSLCFLLWYLAMRFT